MVLPVGFLYDYIKNLELQQKWIIKKQSMGIQSKPKEKTALQTLMDDFNSSTITNKLNCGKVLTTGELEYLRKNKPELYEKAVKVMKERRIFKRELLRCRTKGDVRRVHMKKLEAFVSELKAAKQEGSQVSVGDVQMRLAHVTDEYNNFLSSERYRDLPNEGETGIVRRKQKKKEKKESAAYELTLSSSYKEEKTTKLDKGSVKKHKKTEALAAARAGEGDSTKNKEHISIVV